MKYSAALEVLIFDYDYGPVDARNLLLKANLDGKATDGRVVITNTYREGYGIMDARPSVFAPLTRNEMFALHDMLMDACKKSVRLTMYNMDHDIADTGNSAVWWETFNICRDLVA